MDTWCLNIIGCILRRLKIHSQAVILPAFPPSHTHHSTRNWPLTAANRERDVIEASSILCFCLFHSRRNTDLSRASNSGLAFFLSFSLPPSRFPHSSHVCLTTHQLSPHSSLLCFLLHSLLLPIPSAVVFASTPFILSLLLSSPPPSSYPFRCLAESERERCERQRLVRIQQRLPGAPVPPQGDGTGALGTIQLQ